MKIEHFRSWGNEEIKLCEHISIFGKIIVEEDYTSEYGSTITLKCKICGIEHEINEDIN